MQTFLWLNWKKKTHENYSCHGRVRQHPANHYHGAGQHTAKTNPKHQRDFAPEVGRPKEIQILYEKKSEGEFKYTDLRNAYRQTKLDVYDEFLRKKLREISQLDVKTYLTVFPNPKDNKERLDRLLRESEDLLHKWAHQNQESAFSKELEILVDQQVFPHT